MERLAGFFTRAHRFPIIFATIYMTFVLSLSIPQVQRHMVFLHKINFPFFADFDNPEKYGIAPSKARNLRLTTSDGVSIGAWHLLPDAYHKEKMPSVFSQPLSMEDFERALNSHPTVLYLHGNAANRAAPFRLSSYAQITSRLSANVVAIDYRGFGDSDGVPTEEGLVKDTRAAWDWIKERCGDQKVMIMGQSLGTGVAAKLTEQLVADGTPPQALAMIAPYASIRSQLATFRIVGIFPVLGPIAQFPIANRFFDYALQTRFSTASVFSRLFSSSYDLKSPAKLPHIIMSHATDDDVIPFSNSELLFEVLLNRELLDKVGKRPFGDGTPSSPVEFSSNVRGPKGPAEYELMRQWSTSRDVEKTKIVTETEIERFAKIQSFAIGSAESGKRFDVGDKENAATVTLIRSHSGGHNGVSDGVMDLFSELGF